MPRPVADYLVEIGREVAPPQAFLTPPEPELVPIWSEEAKDDPQAAIDTAREEGRAAGVEEARTDCEIRLAQAREEFENELMSARQAWAREEGEHLRDGITAALSSIEARLADSVARVLRPFIIAVLRQQMLTKLAENVRTLVGSAEKIAIKIAGPADLVEILRDELQAAPAAIEYVTQDSLDISVIADQTSIDTQLKAWTDLMSREG